MRGSAGTQLRRRVVLGPSEMVEVCHWTADHGLPDSVWLDLDFPRFEDSGRTWVKLTPAQARSLAAALTEIADVVDAAVAAGQVRSD